MTSHINPSGPARPAGTPAHGSSRVDALRAMYRAYPRRPQKGFYAEILSQYTTEIEINERASQPKLYQYTYLY